MTISVRHEHDDHFHVGIRHHGLVVDQPRDAGGTDVGPTPTELFVAALAACAAHYARRFLTRHGIPSAGLRVDCGFEMSTEPPARVASIAMTVALPPAFPAELREPLMRVLDRCTVKNSIRVAPDVSVSLTEASAAA